MLSTADWLQYLEARRRQLREELFATELAIGRAARKVARERKFEMSIEDSKRRSEIIAKRAAGRQ